jgi:hypothetical protein
MFFHAFRTDDFLIWLAIEKQIIKKVHKKLFICIYRNCSFFPGKCSWIELNYKSIFFLLFVIAFFWIWWSKIILFLFQHDFDPNRLRNIEIIKIGITFELLPLGIIKNEIKLIFSDSKAFRAFNHKLMDDFNFLLLGLNKRLFDIWILMVDL